MSTAGSCRIHSQVSPCPLPGPAVSTAGSRCPLPGHTASTARSTRVYCRVTLPLQPGLAVSTAGSPPPQPGPAYPLPGPAVHCRVLPSLRSLYCLQSTNTQAHQAAYLADSVPDTMTLHESTRSIQASNLSDTCRQAEPV